jgi:hypothetical protein
MQDFANNAASFSACPGTKSNGGDLGEVRQQEFHGDMLGIPLQFEGNINGIVMEYWFNVVIKHGNWKFPKHAGFRQIIELNVGFSSTPCLTSGGEHQIFRRILGNHGNSFNIFEIRSIIPLISNIGNAGTSGIG